MDAVGLAALWTALAGPLSSARVPPPTLRANAFAELAAGRIVRNKLPGDGLAAFGVLPVSQALLWLTVTDDHLSDDVAELTEVRLHGAWSSPKTLYQRIDLPWPFADRHYVLRSENNAALAAHGVWERAWHVDNTEIQAARALTDAALFDAAETLSVNRGDWLLVPVDAEHTLTVYQSWTDLGGAILPEATEAWSRATVEGLFRSVEKHSVDVEKRYGPGCAVQGGPDGVPIPCG